MHVTQPSLDKLASPSTFYYPLVLCRVKEGRNQLKYTLGKWQFTYVSHMFKQ